MLRSRIFLFILLNVLNRFNCLQRSDWTYNRETDVVILTINGTTYSCRSSDITGSLEKRSMMDSISRTSMNDVKLADDPECVSERISGDFLPISAHQMSADLSQGEDSCNVPLPTVEETLERVKKVYLSSSPNGICDADKWYVQVIQNLMELKTDNVSRQEQISILCGRATSVYCDIIDTLPTLREEVSELYIALKLAKGQETILRSTTSANYSDAGERRERELLLELEVQALKDSRERELETWHKLAESRLSLIKMTSLRKEKERQATEAALRVDEARMQMLIKIGEANEMLASIEAKMRNITYSVNEIMVHLLDEHNQIEE